MNGAAPNKMLADLLAETDEPVGPEVTAIAAAARGRHGESVCAVLFYGSCLWRGYREDDVVDLYLLVDRYRDAHDSSLAALANWALPPNVSYVETVVEGRTVRAKYALISMTDFERGASGRWFHPYIWARFAQPCRMVYRRDGKSRVRVAEALANASRTLGREVLPLMWEPFSSHDLWTAAFKETYRAELRAERADRAGQLYDAASERYARFAEYLRDEDLLQTGAAASASDALFRPTGTRWQRGRARRKWAMRRVLGKVLSVLRLAKAAFTFQDGAEYLLWKVERHSGVSIAVTPWQRRHVILASSVLFWRLYRKGAFK